MGRTFRSLLKKVAYGITVKPPFFYFPASLSNHYQLDTNSKYKISYIAEYGNAQGKKQLFHKRLFLPHMIIIERSTHDAEQGSNQPT